MAGPRAQELTRGPGLLAPEEPLPVLCLNQDGPAQCLLVCDHADNRVPAALGQLGLGPAELAQHIAWDIGALAVTRHMSAALDAPALYSSYSRLVIDLNRHLDDPGSIALVSDGVIVPGNQGVDEEEAARRAHSLFAPYHRRVAQEIDRLRGRGAAPVLVAIHSFTPVMGGMERPWEIGVLWDRDGRIAEPLMAALNARGDCVVGANVPYSARFPRGYTFEFHAEAQGLPHVLLELRQDLIATPAGAARWAGIVTGALAPILADETLHQEIPPP